MDSGGSIDGMITAADKALSMANGSTRIIPGHGPYWSLTQPRPASGPK